MRTLFVLLLSFVTVLYASCGCTKKLCSSSGIELRLNGFSQQDADTIYQIVDGDTTVEHGDISSDSVYTYHVRESGDLYIGTITVWIPGADKTYSFSDFRYEKENCNQCFPVGHDKYDAYKGCVMNGVSYDTAPIDVYR